MAASFQVGTQLVCETGAPSSGTVIHVVEALTPGRSAAAPTPRWTTRELRPRAPQLVAWAMRGTAILTLSSLAGRSGDSGTPWQNAILDGMAVAVVVMVSAVILVLARALARRKRRAWRLVLALVLITAGLYGHRQAWLVLALNLAMAAVLWWTRGEFRAQSEPNSRWLAVRAGLITAAVTGSVGFLLVARAAPRISWENQLWETMRGMLGLYPRLGIGSATRMQFLSFALPGLGAATAAVVLYIWLSPRQKPAELGPADEAQVRQLLSRFVRQDSLGYFAVRRDKTAIFSASGKAAISYRVIGAVSLASGDPLGDPEAWSGAISAWLAEAEDYAWTPGVLGASKAGAKAYVRAGLDALEIGDEAVLEFPDFSLSGRRMRVVRQAVSRAVRAGYQVQIDRQGDLSPTELAKLIAAAERMRNGDVERGFSMALGRLGDARDPDVLLARASTASGQIVALASLVPWGKDGLSLDLMRRDPESENGALELIVASVAERAIELGVTRLSLNFAVFRSALERGSEVGAGPILRAWRGVLVWASRWWQIESLYRANAKYHPQWQPRLICFRRAADVPRVALAALQAEAFVVRPNLAKWLRPRR